MTVIFVVGAIAVDVGLWLSEKRGAQSDEEDPAESCHDAFPPPLLIRAVDRT